MEPICSESKIVFGLVICKIFVVPFLMTTFLPTLLYLIEIYFFIGLFQIIYCNVLTLPIFQFLVIRVRRGDYHVFKRNAFLTTILNFSCNFFHKFVSKKGFFLRKMDLKKLSVRIIFCINSGKVF